MYSTAEVPCEDFGDFGASGDRKGGRGGARTWDGPLKFVADWEPGMTFWICPKEDTGKRRGALAVSPTPSPAER